MLQIFCKESDNIKSSTYLAPIDNLSIEATAWMKDYKRVLISGTTKLLDYNVPARLHTTDEIDFYHFVMFVYALLELPAVIFVMHDTPTIPQFYYNRSASIEQNHELARQYNTPLFDGELMLIIPFITSQSSYTLDPNTRMQYAYLLAALLKVDTNEFKIMGATHYSKSIMYNDHNVIIRYLDDTYATRYLCAKLYYQGDASALTQFIKSVNNNEFMIIGKANDSVILDAIFRKYPGSEINKKFGKRPSRY